MRHFVFEEPYSQSAIWSRRLAVFALILALIGVVIIRFNAIEVSAGITVFGVAILLACIALLLAGAGAAVIWRTGRKGALQIVSTIILCALILAYPAWLAIQAVRLPLINDISTDVNDPPMFSQSQKAVAARSGVIKSSKLKGALQQQQAYSDIQPILIDLEADEVFVLVDKALKNLGWKVIEQVTPAKNPVVKRKPVRRGNRRRGNRLARPEPVVRVRGFARGGRFEAIDRSLIMGFPDDISIRLRPLGAQTRIDIRSASRYGRHDFGANAKRIRRFAAELQTQLDAR